MKTHELGMIGLGVMGRNLLLNMADRGHPVAGYDRDPDQGLLLERERGSAPILVVDDPKRLCYELRTPRVIMMMVPAGTPVDAVIADLLPTLAPGDVLIDGGNSHYADTDRRGKALAEHGVQFVGMGVSGGSRGARYGPSLMPGGPREAYARIQEILKSIAAKVEGEPCVAYLGAGAAGHYVKMVHNGIEYGIMQMIAETYDLLRRGLGLDNARMQGVFERWNQGELRSFLVEITARILGRADARTGGRLIDVILDEARQKGTGMWTSRSAMELQTPVPTIDAAVTARDLSALGAQRKLAAGVLDAPAAQFPETPDAWCDRFRDALYAGMLVTFAQGLSLLATASRRYAFGLDIGEVVRIWRGGCIIHADLLDDLRAATRRSPDVPNLLLDTELARLVLARQDGLRATVAAGVGAGIPLPALAASITYLDGYRSARLPANMIQAQRDFFGAHTYERIDEPGTFHTNWAGDAPPGPGPAQPSGDDLAPPGQRRSGQSPKER